jgi:hypothetical protein
LVSVLQWHSEDKGKNLNDQLVRPLSSSLFF